MIYIYMLDVSRRCDILNAGVGVTVSVGVVLALNVKSVRWRVAIWVNVYALNRSQKRCFMIF